MAWSAPAGLVAEEDTRVTIDEQRHGKAAVLRPEGPVIGADCDQLADHIARVLDENCSSVILDTSRVPFVDSRGLEVLVDATERLIRSGQVLKLAGSNDTLKEVLELTELASLFEQYDDTDAAVRSIQ